MHMHGTVAVPSMTRFSLLWYMEGKRNYESVEAKQSDIIVQIANNVCFQNLQKKSFAVCARIELLTLIICLEAW
jgi:hypothetical protein